MIGVAAVVGYAIGSLPTAIWLAQVLKGIDLRSVGSGNPGANNALRSGGAGLAAGVLLIEMVKGSFSVLIGGQMAGASGAVAAGLGAIAGNIYNPWLRFRGGKGLGITAGVLLALWPTVMVPMGAVLAIAVWLTKSSAKATLISIVVFVVVAFVWMVYELPMGWGRSAPAGLVILAVGVGVLLWPRHWSSLRSPSPV